MRCARLGVSGPRKRRPGPPRARQRLPPRSRDLRPSTCCHTFQATGITAYLSNGLERAQLDSLLTALRTVIDTHGSEAFPAERLEEAMRARGKSLTFEEEELEDLVESKDRAFALLSVLYPFVDTQNNKFHIDHVFPKSRFSSRRLRRAGVFEDDIERYQARVDRLPNLQLLAGDLNQSKSDVLPGKWIATFEPRMAQEYAEHHDLGDVPADITGFNVFYEARRARLLSRLRRLLGTDRRERGNP